MHSVERLSEIETLYRRVLDLTREQEDCLRSGDLGVLPSLLDKKTQTLTKAQHLTALVQASGGDRSEPAFREALARVSSVLADVVEAEERCKALVPLPCPSARRQQAIAAYGGSMRNR